MNYRANYVVVQSVHLALALLAFLYVADWAREAELTMIARFFALLPIVVGAAFVFYTTKAFYLIARRDES